MEWSQARLWSKNIQEYKTHLNKEVQVPNYMVLPRRKLYKGQSEGIKTNDHM